MQRRLTQPVWPGVLHDPDLQPPEVCGSLRRKLVHPVKPVTQPTREAALMALAPSVWISTRAHVGKGQPRLGQSPRARGGIATPGEIDVAQ
jgi:hypothetical protein